MVVGFLLSHTSAEEVYSLGALVITPGAATANTLRPTKKGNRTFYSANPLL